MNPCRRPPCPAWLETHWDAWGREYEAKLEADPRYRFAWKRYRGQRVNRRLLPLLREMTGGHCAYCDWFPTDGPGTDSTVDHFRPKRRFPREAYAWPNLYLCCRACQRKDDSGFCDDLLRPDEDGYRFERYFVFNYEKGTIEPNLAASEEDQERARLTIRHFRMNAGGRPAARRRELLHFRRLDEQARVAFLPDFPFRFLLEVELELSWTSVSAAVGEGDGPAGA